LRIFWDIGGPSQVLSYPFVALESVAAADSTALETLPACALCAPGAAGSAATGPAGAVALLITFALRSAIWSELSPVMSREPRRKKR